MALLRYFAVVLPTNPSENSKVGVVVLGMGRSGTSSVTRMFANAGFFVGHENELMPANEANPAGHWERLGVWRANEQILERLGASWFDPPPAAAQLTVRDWAVPLLQAEVDRLILESRGTAIVLKDPRIGVMMTLWGPIIRQYFHPVLVIRDPLEIALSLLHRDGTPTPSGLAAWEIHMTSLLRELSGHQATIAPYALLTMNETLAQSAVGEASINVASRLTVNLSLHNAHKAFDPTLYRNKASSGTHNDHLTIRQKSLWHYISSLPLGNHLFIDVPHRLTTADQTSYLAVRRETQRIHHRHLTGLT